MNRQTVCVTLCCLHLLILAVSTYIASANIRTILITGWICSISGLLAGLTALMCEKRLLANAALLTPVMAVTLYVLEGVYWDMGPDKAAVPFGIVFLVNQSITSLIVLLELNRWQFGGVSGWSQVNLRTMMVLMASFSVYFAVLRVLLETKHNWLMVVALILLGVTFVGLSLFVYFAGGNRLKSWMETRRMRLAEEAF